jgi:hypothetical protein
MQYYAISPLNGLDVVKNCSHYLVVAQWLKNQAYRVFFKSRVAAGCHLILDNGAYEFGEAMPDEEYWMYIGQMNPSIVVAPDKFQDGQETVMRVNKFLNQMETQFMDNRFEVMGVPQGKTIREWFICFEYLCEMVDVIGIPTAQFGDRTGIVRQFLSSKIDDKKTPRIHLLGLWNPTEVMHYHDVPRVQSIDTSMPFKYAEKGLSLFAEKKPPADWKLDWEKSYNETELKLAAGNLKTFMEMCKGV